MNAETQYVDPISFFAERTEGEGVRPVTRVHAGEKGNVFELPGIWSDQKIIVALQLANDAYLKGVQAGKEIKTKELLELLGR